MGSKKGATKQFYPEEIKLEVIRMKLRGDYSNAEIYNYNFTTQWHIGFDKARAELAVMFKPA